MFSFRYASSPLLAALAKTLVTVDAKRLTLVITILCMVYGIQKGARRRVA